MILSRRKFTAAAAGISATAALPATAKPSALPFILVGDWGRAGHEEQSAVGTQMGKTAAQIKSAFTISVGDNFYENGVTSIDDPQWRNSFENIYTASSLQTPWKVILGNHDYRGNVQAQIDYSHASARWRLPARYYMETLALPGGGRADIFYLDTSPFIKKYIGSKVNIAGQDTMAQLNWLDRELAASRAPWKIVIGHHPIYTALDNSDGGEHDQPDMIARINPLLLKHMVPVYICGHDHLLQSVKMHGVTYVVTGAGSQTYTPGPAIRGGFASGSHGFMTARLSSARFDYSLMDMHGNALFSETIQRT